MQRIPRLVLPFVAAGLLAAVGCQPSTPMQSEPPPERETPPGMETPPPEEQPGEWDVEPEPEEPMPGEMGQPQDQPQMDADARQFIEQATQAGMAEVELSQMVLDKTQTPAVRELAQKMVDDHTKANQELAAIARQAGVDVPRQMSQDAMQNKQELETLQGKELDEKYADIMVEEHRKAIDMFREQAEAEGDSAPELQQFAARRLPTLEDHLKHVQAVQAGKPYMGPQAAAPRAKPVAKTATAKVR